MEQKLILKNSNGSLSADGKTLTGTSGTHWAFASVDDVQYSSGKHRFAFRYDGLITGLGIASVDSNLDGYWLIGRNTPGKQRGLCVAGNSFVNATAGSKYPDDAAYCQPFSIGDIVEMEVDFDNGTMEFFKNSISLEVCFTDINTLPKPMYIIVCAVREGGSGQITIVETPTPTTPIAIPANLATNAGDAKVSLSWTAVTDAAGYNVKRATTAGGPYTTIASNVSGATYVDGSVTNGTTYYYVVSSVATAGESGNSNEASATPNKILIPTPVNLTASAGDAQVSLSWTTVTGAAGYNVKRATTAGGPYTTIASNVSGATYVDGSVTNGTTYYYVVSAVSAAGESGNSNEAAATPNKAVTPPVPGGNVLLRIVMSDSSEREYTVSKSEVTTFVSWYNRTVNTGNTCYTFTDSIDGSLEYLAFEKIISFKVLQLSK
ncbi:hypothetical protein [Azotosporobacter soli]|uniref:hypothetical protein n=1 Tax=Azotosporobacter soli TaxID=3055040 RepID=UPI0031FEB1C4